MSSASVAPLPGALSEALVKKLDLLRVSVRQHGSALVAFSGGADSALVLKIAADELPGRVVALTAISPTMARREQRAAAELAAELGVPHEAVASHELERPGFRQNPTDRCYHCKSELFEIARPVQQRLGLAAVLLGTNTDDLGDHRPGLQAAREQAAAQPLVEAGLDKAEVRALSRALGLRTWDKPQMACLSSRFPYGTEITDERLARVDALEEALWDLGFRQLRVRFHDDVARLELLPEELERALALRETIVAASKRVGFRFVALDLQGFRSGALNEGLVKLRR